MEWNLSRYCKNESTLVSGKKDNMTYKRYKQYQSTVELILHLMVRIAQWSGTAIEINFYNFIVANVLACA